MDSLAMSAIVPDTDERLDEFLFNIDSARITPVFQPIVDLRHGVSVAFEVLSRGPAPFCSPERMFERACELGVTWELERACRTAAFRAIATVGGDFTYFLNVSPDVIDDPRFAGGFTHAALEENGIASASIVIEI